MSLRNTIVLSIIILMMLLICNISAQNSKLPIIKFIDTNKYVTSYIPESDTRSLDQTILTFPEWYLVYSPEEMAELSKSQTLDRFPFYNSIWQYWDSYLTVSEYARQINSSNWGYHVMLLVIGTSTTIEYFLRGIYENSVGRFTFYLAGRSEEDDYAANVSSQYATFINYYPWYEFNFWHSLVGLWHLPLSGENFIRKIERRYILTTDYLAKFLYAKIIGLLTHSAFGVAKLNTIVIINKSPKNLKDIPQYKQLKTIGNDFMVELPRYDLFKSYALDLAKQDIDFVDIAGNRGFIAVSIISKEFQETDDCQILFKQEIYTKPGYERVFVITPVRQLSNFLRRSINQQFTIEHIYDY